MPDDAAPDSAADRRLPGASPPRTGVFAWMPGLWVLRHYRRSWFPRDVVAGLVLTALLVPAGMGYAEAAGLPAITGLYATIAPLLAYAIVGPSRILVYGPDSALAPLIAAAVIARGAGDPPRAIALAGVLALMTGVLCVAAGVARAGFVTDLLSKPVRVGYTNGIALTVLVTQLPKLFGVSVAASDLVDGAVGFARAIVEGRTLPIALSIGGACLAFILVVRKVAPRVPGVLVAVVGATVTVAWLDLGDRIKVVGTVPRGVPLPAFPLVAADDLGPLLVAALGISVVSFADSSVLSRTFAARHGERVDPNRELVALGIANVAAGLFRGFPISSSASRTPVAESAGSRTQLTGVVGAVTISLLLVVAPRLLAPLPTAALAAVVISAAIRLFDLAVIRVFYRVRRSDFVLTVVAFFAVAALGVLRGIAVAVALSLLDVVRRAWRPHHAILGRAPGVKGYHDLKRYPNARQIPGLLLVRWDAPLFFANADLFRERVVEMVTEASSGVQWVVIAAEPITDVDTTAAEMLEELDKELSLLGVELAFAEMKDPVKDRLERYGLQKKIGRDFFFPTLGVAVKAFRDRTGVAWTDWEDEL
ncbi:MAG: sulfate permease [Deltaproteobacteria bacterium]|nr:sulfate permease [Deltaproteobacteria bacterium]